MPFLLLLDGESEVVSSETAVAFILDGIEIKAPIKMTESTSKQFAQQRVLVGNINRDYFGDTKKTWALSYENLTKSDYDTIKAIYESYLENGVKTWEITGDNYSVSPTDVHIDLPVVAFPPSGIHYITNFTLTLWED